MFEVQTPGSVFSPKPDPHHHRKQPLLHYFFLREYSESPAEQVALSSEQEGATEHQQRMPDQFGVGGLADPLTDQKVGLRSVLYKVTIVEMVVSVNLDL